MLEEIVVFRLFLEKGLCEVRVIVLCYKFLDVYNVSFIKIVKLIFI